MGLLNGLSSAGAAISQYAGAVGLQAQKADLANQSLALADQLQGARESAGRVQAGDIAAAAADKQQAFQAGQTLVTEAGANSRNAATNATSAANNALTNLTSRQNNTATINGDTPEEKLLRDLGALPPKGTAPASAATAPAAAPVAAPSAGGTPALSSDGLVVDGPAPGSSPSIINGSTATSAPVGGSPDPKQNSPLLNKALGLPQPGTPAALEMGVARDVAADPAFANLSPGQQALETAKRIAVSAGKMTDPQSRTAMATGIANYQMAPLGAQGLNKAGGPETMAEVMKINPDYQAARFPAVSQALESFSTGKQGDIVRSLNVGVQHLSVLDDAATALSNNNTQALNSLKNKLLTQFGYSETPTFDALKQIVGTEVEKAVAGGIGAVSDRDRIMKALDSASSPAQLKAVTDGFRSLMVGQLSGLKTQYEDATGIKTGPFTFENKLDPETKSALTARRGDGVNTPAATAPAPTRSDPMAAARAAIAAGAPRAAVMARLKANGIDPSGLDDASVSSALPSAGQD